MNEKTRRVIQSVTPHTGTIKLRSAHHWHFALPLVISSSICDFICRSLLSHAYLSIPSLFSLMTVGWWNKSDVFAICTTTAVLTHFSAPCLTNLVSTWIHSHQHSPPHLYTPAGCIPIE